MYKKIGLFSLLFVIVDQVIKLIVSHLITLNTEIKIIPGFFYLANVHNEGAAFSVLNGSRLFLIIINIGVAPMKSPNFAFLSFNVYSKSSFSSNILYSSLFLSISSKFR